MTLRSDILARFTGEGGATPLFLPDLTLWHAWHRERDTLPTGWRDFTLPQAARHLNTPIWAVARPWQVATPGVITTSEESVVERVIRHETPFRDAHDALHPWAGRRLVADRVSGQIGWTISLRRVRSSMPAATRSMRPTWRPCAKMWAKTG